METTNLKEQLGFQRAISVSSDKNNLSESQLAVIEQVEKFGIDEVYFCTDEFSSYPAVFLKEVICFDENTLKCIAQIHRKVWNYKKILFLYVYNDTEIRIYNCAEKPFVETKITDYESELNKLEIKRASISDVDKLNDLNKVFSSISIDTGIIWTLEDALEIRNKINLQRRVDKYLVDSLIKTGKSLQEDGLKDIDIIHKLMMRSLFLLYLEDRGATDANFYANINKDASSYFDILNNVDDTFSLFKKLEKHFNGNVFSLAENEQEYVTKNHLKLIKQCFISGYEGSDIVQLSLFEDWRLFNFQIIQIELLSEIYENFLSEIDPSQKQQTGTFYTPPSLVELILNEKLPVNKNDKNYDIKVLDPACGSGIFLVESFKRLVKRYENKHGERLTDFEELKKLLTDNIFGIEISPQSIKVAAFSLYLALLDNLNPKTLWQYRILPYLINDPKTIPSDKQGKNLYCRDTIETNEEIEKIEFDLVVGNPPFGTENKPNKILPESIRTYCDNQSFAKEMVLPFLHKAIKFSPKGEIAMIFNTKVLTNTGPTYQNFREWLFNVCHVEKLYNFSILRNVPKNFGGQLFGSAIGPISIVFYKKEAPENISKRIVYYAPKTFIKSNILEGVVIDSSDVKYLPREECQKRDTKIWKITMWGDNGDFMLINKISSKFDSIGKFLDNQISDWSLGSGLHSPSKEQIEKKQFFIPQKKLLNLKRVDRYYTNETSADFSNKIFRPTNENLFSPPFLLIKEGQRDKEFCASYVDFNCYHTGYSIATIQDNSYLLKMFCGLINSDFAKYYLSLTSASWGIERERVQSNEMLELPAIITTDLAILRRTTELIDQIIEIKKQEFYNDITSIESKLGICILRDVLNLSDEEIIRINDVIETSLDLFESKEKSKALLPIQSLDDYANMLCNELNDFLEGQNLFSTAITFPLTSKFSPLAMIKITFGNLKREISESIENIETELKRLDKNLWEQKAGNLYFRKKLNYKDGDDIFIIRPNQRRFWTQTKAIEDASELILEILNED